MLTSFLGSLFSGHGMLAPPPWAHGAERCFCLTTPSTTIVHDDISYSRLGLWQGWKAHRLCHHTAWEHHRTERRGWLTSMSKHCLDMQHDKRTASRDMCTQIQARQGSSTQKQTKASAHKRNHSGSKAKESEQAQHTHPRLRR